MKKIILCICAVLCLCCTSYATTRTATVLINKNLKIQYNQETQRFQDATGMRVYPISYMGTTYLPIRAISSLFHEKIQWDGINNSIYLGKGSLDTTASRTESLFTADENENVEVFINEDINIYYYDKLQFFKDVNGARVYPLTYNGTTYLPVRAISNLFNKQIEWDILYNTVKIFDSNSAEPVTKSTTATTKTTSTTSTTTPTTSMTTSTISPTTTTTSTTSDIHEVVEPVQLSLNKTLLKLQVGDTAVIEATVLPDNATKKTVIWEVSNSKIARVSNGKVTALDSGTTVITARVEGTKLLKSCIISVASNPSTDVQIIPVTGFGINKNSLSLKVGESAILTATVRPSNATNKEVTWESSNERIARVSNGKVIAIASGTTVITAKVEGTKLVANCTVSVTTKPSNDTTISVTDIKLNKNSVSLKVGESTTVIATISPSNASNKTITWQSVNETIAKVSSGKITAIKEGTTIINAKTQDGNKVANCIVTVTPSVAPTPSTVKVTGIAISKNIMSIKVGESATLTATVNPSNATNKEITWVSNDERIVKVSNGKVTAIKEGLSIITAKTVDGNMRANCIVTVQSPVNIVTFDQRNKAVIAYLNDSERNVEKIFKNYCKGKSLKGYHPNVYNTNLVGDINLYLYDENTNTKSLIKKVSKDMLSYYLIPGNTYYLESVKDKTKYECVKLTGNVRMLYVPGVYNIRDLGGWNADGGTLKYGKIIRSAIPYSISNEAVFQHLNIQLIVNLCSATSYKQSLSHFKSIKKVNAPPGMYLKDKSPNPRKAVRNIMKAVVSGKNVLFHCQVGTDRTGTVAYVVEGLLGVPKEQRLDDYELSYFWRELTNHGKKRSVITQKNGMYSKINAYSSYNKEQEKFMNWFLAGSSNKSADVELINQFRKVMIDGNPKEYTLVKGKVKEK